MQFSEQDKMLNFFSEAKDIFFVSSSCLIRQ